MATNNMHNLTTLIKRLEAATSRLEDIASSAFEGQIEKSQDATANGVLASGIAAAGTVGSHTSTSTANITQAPTPVAAAPKEELPAIVEEFDNLIKPDLKAYHELSKSPAIGGLLGEQSDSVVKAFEALRQFLLVTTKAKKPDVTSQTYMDTLKDLQLHMTKVDDIRQSNRASPVADGLAMVADGVGALAWVTIDFKPADWVSELFGGAQMYGNKVLKKYKDTDEAQVEWVKSFYKLMRSLVSYIKQSHPKGVQWNPQGVDAAQALKDIQSGEITLSVPPPPPPMPSGGSIPPPPGPPPPPGSLPPPPAAKSNRAQADMGAVFADLNRGESVTAGLRKVDPSQMTHKNPSLRAGSTVPQRSDSSSSAGRGVSPAPPGKKPKPESLRTKKPPKKELDGNKWIIENFESPSAPIEIEAEINHSILITKCKGTTLRIHGKANAISIDNSSKTSLILDSLVSSVDVIKCPSFAIQILETVPTILLDQVDGAQIYLSKDSLNTDIFTSKCTSVNVNLPPQNEDDDYVEAPVPEQFRSYVKDGKLVTEIVEHAG
ncbi:uncharacterized protein PV09_00663 [Verruconis gallopava]|uniref:Adenylyl cyclase-associated protein n=1 Tax=Verruconis gallopava TaxID=253628 RepID=A0A0D2AQC5_9PEZI|nr:uncharacterized protein PV09_00663 [Verruconis gallopava]KIW08720.1 hypothetical protein PV09_00663 [Verruconis gallopava]